MTSLRNLNISERVSEEMQRLAQDESISSDTRKLLRGVADAAQGSSNLVVIPEDAVVSPNRAAELIGMSRSHLLKLLDRGDIPFDRVGNHRKIRINDLRDYENARHQRRLELAERFAHQKQTMGAAEEEISRFLT